MSGRQALGAVAVVGLALSGSVMPALAVAAETTSTQGGSVQGDAVQSVPMLPRQRDATTSGSAAISVIPARGAEFADVLLTVALPASPGPVMAGPPATAGPTATPRATVTLRDGSTVIARGLPVVDGVATLATNALGPGRHRLAADVVDAAGCHEVATADVNYGNGDDAGNVSVTIPRGALTITSPSTLRPVPRAGASIDDIVITDTRAGNLGFAASVVATGSLRGWPRAGGAHVGLVDVRAVQVPGNALLARDVTSTSIAADRPGLGRPRVFARLPAGRSTGTVRMHARLDIGRGGVARTTQLTFTAM